MFALNALKISAPAAIIAAGIVAAGWTGAATASTTYSSCSGTGYDLSLDVSSNDGCQISSAKQDKMGNPNALTVNEGGGFFGDDAWAAEGQLDANGTLDGDAAKFGDSGSFDLSSYFEGMVGQVLLVFKSTKGPATLVGYLFTLDADGATTLTGNWTTPFTCPPFKFDTLHPANQCKNFPKDVAHISVYSDVAPAPVPLPATGLLLLGGLGALGAARRGKRHTPAA
jgi:hypothetical protein